MKQVKCLVSKSTSMSNFHPLEVVGRGSETLLQVGKNVNYWEKMSEMFGLKVNKYVYFHPLEVVGRGSETQLQVGENIGYLILRFKG